MNLAIADILIAAVSSPTTYISPFLNNSVWSLGPFLCDFTTFEQCAVVMVYAYTLVAISIDRFLVYLVVLSNHQL